MNDIEKCAIVMGYKVESLQDGSAWIIQHDKPLNRDGEHPIRLFNPFTNAQDREDLMCELGISVGFQYDLLAAKYFMNGVLKILEINEFSKYPTKQAALAHAVVSVAVQIYDAKFGGQE